MEEKVFTQSDITEIQKSFNDTLKSIHSNLYNILLNTKENKSNIINLISYVSDEMKIIEEDIKIEASTSDKTEDTSN